MEAKELMINDWVIFNGKPAQITIIDNWEDEISYFDDNAGGVLTFKHKDVKPIQLTEEMLLKNGFEDYGEILSIKWKDGADDCELNLRKMYNKDNVCDAFGCMIGGCVQLIVYVQELQHLLRLCELNDLADNFKI